MTFRDVAILGQALGHTKGKAPDAARSLLGQTHEVKDLGDSALGNTGRGGDDAKVVASAPAGVETGGLEG